MLTLPNPGETASTARDRRHATRQRKISGGAPSLRERTLAELYERSAPELFSLLAERTACSPRAALELTRRVFARAAERVPKG